MLAFARRMAEQYELVMFFVLAYAWAWAFFFPMAAFHWPMQVTIAATFGPTVAALIVHRLRTGNYRAFRVFPSLWRGIVASALGVVLVVFAYVVLPAALTTNPTKLVWSVLLSVRVYKYSTFLAGPLGEEFGWRGFALPRLEKRFGPVLASIVLAMLWGCWHLPLLLIPGWVSAPFWIYLLILTGLSFLFTVSTNLARFAVLPAFLIHAMFNTVSRFLNGMFQHTQPSAPVSFELVMALCGLGVAGMLVLVTLGQLGYPTRSGVAATARLSKHAHSP